MKLRTLLKNTTSIVREGGYVPTDVNSKKAVIFYDPRNGTYYEISKVKFSDGSIILVGK